MGLSIYYSGMLRSPDLIPEIIAEATDIAQSLQWTFTPLPVHKEIPITGVLISPEGSEPLWLTFHKDGFLCNPILYEYVWRSTGELIQGEHPQKIFTKTQYAGVDAHMAMIKLMRHLSEKYFSQFELCDESEFWETGDEDKCRQRFRQYDQMMDMVGAELDKIEFREGESQEAVAERIEKVLKEKFGDIVQVTHVGNVKDEDGKDDNEGDDEDNQIKDLLA